MIWNNFGKQVAQFAARFGPDRFGEGLERAARMAIEVKQKEIWSNRSSAVTCRGKTSAMNTVCI